MKKYLSLVLCVFFVCLNTALADKETVSANLHSQIRWYAEEVRKGFARAFALTGMSNENYELQKKAYSLVYNELNYENEVVICSPAELIEKCIQTIGSIESADRICAKAVQSMIKTHNDFVKEYTARDVISINDTDKIICWNQHDFAPRKIFGTGYEAFWNVFYSDIPEIQKLHDCIKMSISDMQEKCDKILANTKIAESVNANHTTCKKFIEDTVNRHNSRVTNLNALQILEAPNQ